MLCHSYRRWAVWKGEGEEGGVVMHLSLIGMLMLFARDAITERSQCIIVALNSNRHSEEQELMR